MYIPSLYWIPKLHKCSCKQRRPNALWHIIPSYSITTLKWWSSRLTTYLLWMVDKSYVTKHILNVLWYWYHQNAPIVLIDNTFVSWTYFSTDSQYFFWYQMLSSSQRRVPFFAYRILDTGGSQEKRKEASQIDPLISLPAIQMISFYLIILCLENLLIASI